MANPLKNAAYPKGLGNQGLETTKLNPGWYINLKLLSFSNWDTEFQNEWIIENYQIYFIYVNDITT